MSDEMDEIWTLYADDGAQSLDTVEEALLRLNEQVSDAETIALLFRAIHTFKGNARVLGLGIIEARAHITEDLIGLVRDEGVPLDSEMLALLLEAADALRGMLEDSVANRRDVDADADGDLARRMTEKFERCRAGEEPVAPSPASADASAPSLTPPPSGDVGSPPLPQAGEGEKKRRSRKKAPLPPPRFARNPRRAGEAGAGEGAEPCEAGEGDADPNPDLPPESVIFDPPPADTLANDSMYREIFAGMVHDVMREMRQAVDGYDAAPHAAQGTLRSEAERLRYAAGQIGMPEWPDVMAAFLDLSDASAGETLALLARMDDMAARDFAAAGAVSAGGSDVRRFFDALEPLLSAVSSFGAQVAAGESVDSDDVAHVTDEIKALAEPLGLVRVVDVAGRLAAHPDAREFRKLELQFYEELASVEALTPDEVRGAKVQPAAVLRGWCADRVFESLLELGTHLDHVRKSENVCTECDRINELMRHLYHACHHYGIETAAHLTMSLVDLFARVQSGEMAPDPVLLHIARSFVASMELVFDAVGSGDAPDMGAIEKLFEEAATVTFTASGTASSSAIEARLGLPKSFHKVLTPESCKAAQTALDDGQHFYIIRADLNQDEEVAGKFLEWINSGIAAVISNVTVFQGDVTLFDFLLATPMGETHLAEAMAVLDPKGSALRVEMALSDRRRGGDGIQAAAGDVVAPEDSSGRAISQDTMSGDMLEAIGEAVAGQAMVHHMLTGLIEEDLVRAVETEIRKAGGEWSAAQGAVRRTLEGFTGRIEQALQAEAQLNTQLARLQEEAIAVRTRSATLLLKPLEAFAEAAARQNGRQVAVSCSGEDLVLDHTMLESLKGPLRGLLTFCATRSIETPDARVAKGKDGRGRIRVGLVRQDDHVAVTVEDDGDAAAGADEFADIQAGLRGQGGDLRVVALPTGGMRFHVTMPMAMVVLDGMVVRVGEVRYVVPLDAIQRIVHSPSQDIMRVSADHGRTMLKLGQEDVVPVGFLETGAAADDGVGLLAAPDAGDSRHLFVVVGKLARRVAVSVDELIGQQVVLVRPLQGYLSGIRGVTGCALLGGGEVGMVLDMGHVLGQAS